MNRKAVAVLTLSAFAFLVAVIMLFSSKINLNPGPNTDYLGQTEVRVFSAYTEGEKMLLYLDMAGKLSYQKLEAFCTNECPRYASCSICSVARDAKTNAAEGISVADNKEFMAMFASYFSRYLEQFNKTYNANANVSDYVFFMDGMRIGGISSRDFKINDGAIDYKFRLSFSAKSRIKAEGLYKISGNELEIRGLPQPAGKIYAEKGEKPEELPSEEPAQL